MKYWLNQIKPFFVIFIFSLISLQIVASHHVYAQNFTFEGNRKKDIIYFDFIKNLIIVPIYINEKGPFNFILDTGVNPMVITDPALKDSLGLKEIRSVKIKGFGEGDEIDAFLANNINASIGAASIKSLPTVIFKEDLFNLSGYVGVKIYGLIGYNFFNSFVVRINYPYRKITFSLNNEKTKFKGERIPLEFIDNKPYIDVQIKTLQTGLTTAKVLVDCGASHALSLESFNNDVYPVPSPNIYGNLGVGLSGEISGNIARIPLLQIGNVSFKNVLANFPKYGEVIAKTKIKERNGNLGSDILKRFNVTFDYKNASMYLKKNDYFNNTFDHDMTGIEIYVSDKPLTRYFISRLEIDSPAEKAGLLVNDEIVGINFRTINTYTLDEISNLFKSDDGKAVIIEIHRKDQTIIKLIKLKRRV